MQIDLAQREMAGAHVRGAPGVFVSGLVWIISSWVWNRYGTVSGFHTLFVGGILIFPVSLVISRIFFGAKVVPKGNPLERLALESTFILFGGILLAYCFLRVAPELAFPAMAVSIGVRYLIFRTIYGNPIYWVLGGSIATIGGVAAMALVTLPMNLALIVGVIEICFSVAIFLFGSARSSHSLPTDRKSA